MFSYCTAKSGNFSHLTLDFWFNNIAWRKKIIIICSQSPVSNYRVCTLCLPCNSQRLDGGLDLWDYSVFFFFYWQKVMTLKKQPCIRNCHISPSNTTAYNVKQYSSVQQQNSNISSVLRSTVHFYLVIQKAIVPSNSMCSPSYCKKLNITIKYLKKTPETTHRDKCRRTVQRRSLWCSPRRCYNPDPVSLRVHGGQSVRPRAFVAEACARCTTPAHFSLFWSLWFWNKPSLRGTPWAPSGKVRSPDGTSRTFYNRPQRDNTDTMRWTHCSGNENIDVPYPSTRPSLNSPSNFMPSYRLKTPVPWNFPWANSPSYLMMEGNKEV